MPTASNISKERNIMMIITESCNLKCLYCYEHSKTKSKMSFQVAKAILDKELNGNGYDRYMIQLFGGEPFLNLELIKEIYEYLETNYSNTKYHIFITSNGTLINKSVQNWLIPRKEKLTVGVSLDGTKNMHDTNRSNSFDLIDIDFFKDTYPRQICKMTISPSSLSSLADGIIYLQKRGLLVSATFAQGVDYGLGSLKILKQQLEILVNFYMENVDVPVCDILDFSNLHLLNATTQIQEKWCGCGKDLVAYDYKGNCYPCQIFAPISIGENAEQFLNRDEDYLKSKGSFLDSKCRNCFIQPLCPTCCGMNYLTRNNMAERDSLICLFTKLRYYYAALLCYNRIFKDRSETDQLTEAEYNTLNGILKIIDCSQQDEEVSSVLQQS